MNVEVRALRAFVHDVTRRRNDTFRCSLHVARQLEQRGLAVITDAPQAEAPPAHPTPAAGAPSSASPADPVSPPQTSSSSADGESQVTMYETPGSDPEPPRKKGGRKKGAA